MVVWGTRDTCGAARIRPHARRADRPRRRAAAGQRRRYAATTGTGGRRPDRVPGLISPPLDFFAARRSGDWLAGTRYRYRGSSTSTTRSTGSTPDTDRVGGRGLGARSTLRDLAAAELSRSDRPRDGRPSYLGADGPGDSALEHPVYLNDYSSWSSRKARSSLANQGSARGRWDAICHPRLGSRCSPPPGGRGYERTVSREHWRPETFGEDRPAAVAASAELVELRRRAAGAISVGAVLAPLP